MTELDFHTSTEDAGGPVFAPDEVRSSVLSAKTLAIVLTIGLGAAAVLTGCEPNEQPGPEYMPDMARGPAYKAFAPNEATRNGITLQKPVQGTIKRGFRPFHYAKGEAEAVRAGVELTNPFHATDTTLKKGQFLFETYCAVCHGKEGKGDGPISSKIPPPPSYKSDRVMAYPPGRFFHIITMGSGKMPSYAVQLQPEERWLIITYIRSQLQGLPEAAPGVGEGASLPATAEAPTTPPSAPPPSETPAGEQNAATPGPGSAAAPLPPPVPSNGSNNANNPAPTPPAAAPAAAPTPAQGSGGHS
ncbi:MAG TPA: cytochrome c [Kofleriaceae bacterium]|nr:cytochrome c [Kofleriaceae bacterium]